MNHTYGPPCPFRTVGFTAMAGLYPKSQAALELQAEFTGCRVDQLPRGARNHSNPYMRDWMEALALRRRDGLDYRHVDGRYYLPSEINA